VGFLRGYKILDAARSFTAKCVELGDVRERLVEEIA
jgi:hypothetical protein